MKTKTKNKIFRLANLCLAAFIFAILFINIVQSNEASREGFLIRDLNKKIAELQNENKDLTLLSTQLQSINRLKKDSEEKLGMVSVDNINYIAIKNNTEIVAKK